MILTIKKMIKICALYKEKRLRSELFAEMFRKMLLIFAGARYLIPNLYCLTNLMML